MVNKIFIIGYNKCGTRSLHGLFAGNGIPSIHWHDGQLATSMVKNGLRGRRLLNGYDHRYKVFSDMICLTDRLCIEGNAYFRILDRDYPGSKFIYNTRNEDEWVRSRIRHRNGAYLRRYQLLLNTDDPEIVIKYWRDSRRRYESALFEYFSQRSDLLVFDIDTGDPETIAKFIGLHLDAGHYGWKGKTDNSGVVNEASVFQRIKWSFQKYFR